mmetsp:Transcript_17282/g.59648  ORF Transcript_17282/g.59648 Transcript_17282/m.59648 type:complete len:249 (-) Transcript_17282:872-1618(-)
MRMFPNQVEICLISWPISALRRTLSAADGYGFSSACEKACEKVHFSSADQRGEARASARLVGTQSPAVCWRTGAPAIAMPSGVRGAGAACWMDCASTGAGAGESPPSPPVVDAAGSGPGCSSTSIAHGISSSDEGPRVRSSSSPWSSAAGLGTGAPRHPPSFESRSAARARAEPVKPAIFRSGFRSVGTKSPKTDVLQRWSTSMSVGAGAGGGDTGEPRGAASGAALGRSRWRSVWTSLGSGPSRRTV